MIVTMNEKSRQAIVAERLMESAKNRLNYGCKTITLYSEGEALVAYGECARDMSWATGNRIEIDCAIDTCKFPKDMLDTFSPRLAKRGFKLCITD